MRALRSLCVALAVVPILGPAAAQDAQMLGIQLRQLTAADNSVLQGAYAACILGGGTVEGAATLFTEAGWTRMDDAEMGMTELRSVASGVTATLYDEGRTCSVVSETMGTEVANGALVPTIVLAGWQVTPSEMADGCTAYQLAEGLKASVTSSGQDPVCYSDDSSDVRVMFGP